MRAAIFDLRPDAYYECSACGDYIPEGSRCDCTDEIHPKGCDCPDCTAGDYDPNQDVPTPSRA